MARLEGRLPSKHERRLVVEYVIGQPSPEELQSLAHMALPVKAWQLKVMLEMRFAGPRATYGL